MLNKYKGILLPLLARPTTWVAFFVMAALTSQYASHEVTKTFGLQLVWLWVVGVAAGRLCTARANQGAADATAHELAGFSNKLGFSAVAAAILMAPIAAAGVVAERWLAEPKVAGGELAMVSLFLRSSTVFAALAVGGLWELAFPSIGLAPTRSLRRLTGALVILAVVGGLGMWLVMSLKLTLQDYADHWPTVLLAVIAGTALAVALLWFSLVLASNRAGNSRATK